MLQVTSTISNPAPARMAPVRTSFAVVAAVVAVVVGFVASTSDLIPLGIAAVVMGGLALYAALIDFYAFVLFVLVVRPVVEVVSTDNGRLEPSGLMGLVFAACAVLWLISRARGGLPVKISAPTGWAGMLTIFIVLSAVSAADAMSIGTSVKMVSALLMLVVLEQLFTDDPDRFHTALRAVLISAVAPAVVALVQTQTGGFDVGYHPIGVTERVRGTFVHPSVLAAFAVIVFWMAFIGRYLYRRGVQRAAMLVLAVAFLPILVLTYTRGAWIAAVVAVVYVGLVLRPKLVLVLGALLVVIVLAVPSVTSRFSDLQSETDATTDTPNSLAWRVEYWGQILPLGIEHPLTGIGIGVTRTLDNYGFEPHNIYLQTFVESGAFATLAFGGLIVSGSMAVRRVRRSAASSPAGRVVAVMAGAVGLSILVEGITDNLLTQMSILYPAMVPLAWVFAASRAPERFAGHPTVVGGSGVTLPRGRREASVRGPQELQDVVTHAVVTEHNNRLGSLADAGQGQGARGRGSRDAGDSDTTRNSAGSDGMRGHGMRSGPRLG